MFDAVCQVNELNKRVIAHSDLPEYRDGVAVSLDGSDIENPEQATMGIIRQFEAVSTRKPLVAVAHWTLRMLSSTSHPRSWNRELSCSFSRRVMQRS